MSQLKINLKTPHVLILSDRIENQTNKVGDELLVCKLYPMLVTTDTWNSCLSLIILLSCPSHCDQVFSMASFPTQ